MRVRSFDDMMQDVADTDVSPGDWRAVMQGREGVGTDLYLAHPDAGVYAAALYLKDPYTVRGVGTKVASGTGPVADYLPDADVDDRFAVRRPPRSKGEVETMVRHMTEVVRGHATAPTSPADLFDDLMDASGSIAHGAFRGDRYRTDASAEQIGATYEDARDVLDTELDDLISEDGIDRGVH